MNYYIDTEFLEGTQEPKWLILKNRLGHLMVGKPKPTIDLISIGIVSEDGREYYAISKDFNLKEAWNRFDISENESWGKDDKRNKVYWIRENVLKPIWRELYSKSNDCTGLSNKQVEAFDESVEKGNYDKYFTFKSLKFLIEKYGKTNKEIAKEIRNFIYVENKKDGGQIILGDFFPNKYPEPKFYAYYADYDWVAFCWLFGNMMDLPKGFPMYCKDLKQMLDEKEKSLSNNDGEIELVSEIIPEHGCSMKAIFNSIKEIGGYPKQENEHNALADARWNKKLHEFLNKIK